jgi:FKBP-type peptidyl-prolyl cis-trans isomerase
MFRLFSYFLTCFFVIRLLCTTGCRQQPQIPSNIPVPDVEKEKLIVINKAIVNKETKKIEQYIAKKQLKLVKDSLGFWCTGAMAKRNAMARAEQTVTYQYSVRLLDETLCYSNLNTSRRTSIRLGKGESFSGLDMAIRKMNIGEQADFIFPSILAYGVSGDGHRIAPYSPLVCTIKLIECSEGK